MWLYRVKSANGPQWMAAAQAFMDTKVPVPMRAIRKAPLFEQEPLAWCAQARTQTLVETQATLVAYNQLLAPVPHLPPVVYGLGLNYAAHSAETKMDLPKFPIVIGKASTSLCGPTDPIIVPGVCNNEVDFEVELAVVIGKPCKNVLASNALSYVLGYTVGNDISARKWQGKKGGGQWTRAKSFDTFMPLGPGIVVQDHQLDPQKFNMTSRVAKGTSPAEVMQSASTSDMIFKVAHLVEFLSQDVTLLPWTIILTGTPAGVGYTRTPPVLLEPRDTVDVEIDGIGVLRNPVQAAT